MDREKSSEYYKKLLSKYPFEDRFKHILTQIQDVLEALGLMDYVYINTALLGQAVIDYFEDIDKLKAFEQIDKVNVDKIYAYETFWLLRRKPVQIIDFEAVGAKNLHINEKIFTFILIAKMLGEMEIDYYDGNDRIAAYIQLLNYNFKFRVYTQKSLELAVSSFFCGCAFIKEGR